MSEPLLHLLHRKAVDLRLLSIGGAGRARVLMYHGIGEEGCHRVNIRHISARVFEHQLGLFKEHFNVVSLRDLCAGTRDPRKLTVALTFDDGLRNNATHALPLLERYRVPATFFITGANPAGMRLLWGDLLDLAERVTDRPLRIAGDDFRKNAVGRYAKEGGQLLRDWIKQLGVFAPKQELYDQLADLVDGPLKELSVFWQLMSDEELERFAQHPLVSIGAHGWWHNDMGRIPLHEVRVELQRSREYLARFTAGPLDMLAWPAGSYSTESRVVAAELGFSKQFAVDLLNSGNANDTPVIMDRFGVFDYPISDRFFARSLAVAAR